MNTPITIDRLANTALGVVLGYMHYVGIIFLLVMVPSLISSYYTNKHVVTEYTRVLKVHDAVPVLKTKWKIDDNTCEAVYDINVNLLQVTDNECWSYLQKSPFMGEEKTYFTKLFKSKANPSDFLLEMVIIAFCILFTINKIENYIRSIGGIYYFDQNFANKSFYMFVVFYCVIISLSAMDHIRMANTHDSLNKMYYISGYDAEDNKIESKMQFGQFYLNKNGCLSNSYNKTIYENLKANVHPKQIEKLALDAFNNSDCGWLKAYSKV